MNFSSTNLSFLHDFFLTSRHLFFRSSNEFRKKCFDDPLYCWRLLGPSEFGGLEARCINITGAETGTGTGTLQIKIIGTEFFKSPGPGNFFSKCRRRDHLFENTAAGAGRGGYIFWNYRGLGPGRSLYSLGVALTWWTDPVCWLCHYMFHAY